MNTFSEMNALTHSTLLKIAKQAGSLGKGLESASPIKSEKSPNNSVLYLLGISAELAQAAEVCVALLSSSLDSTGNPVDPKK